MSFLISFRFSIRLLSVEILGNEQPYCFAKAVGRWSCLLSCPTPHVNSFKTSQYQVAPTRKDNYQILFSLPLRDNYSLASCPWGPATAHGVGILTELYVIYMERNTASRYGAMHKKLPFQPRDLPPCQIWRKSDQRFYLFKAVKDGWTDYSLGNIYGFWLRLVAKITPFITFHIFIQKVQSFYISQLFAHNNCAVC